MRRAQHLRRAAHFRFQDRLASLSVRELIEATCLTPADVVRRVSAGEIDARIWQDGEARFWLDIQSPTDVSEAAA